MGEPRAITYKQVERAGGNAATWAQIGKITGAGDVPRNAAGDASIDLTDVSDAKMASIDALLGKKEEAAAENKSKTK